MCSSNQLKARSDAKNKSMKAWSIQMRVWSTKMRAEGGGENEDLEHENEGKDRTNEGSENNSGGVNQPDTAGEEASRSGMSPLNVPSAETQTTGTGLTDAAAREASRVFLQATFWNLGHATITGFMSAEEEEIVLRAARQTDQKTWLSQLRDPNRRQALIDMRVDQDAAPAAFRLVVKRLIDFASSIHDAWSILELLTLLESRPKSKGEQLHRDFQASETAEATVRHEWVQVSVLLVLEPGTKILLVPEAFGGCVVRSKCEALEDLQPGDLVILRDDIPHTEPKYTKGNIRIQGCINIDGVDHEDMIVEIVPWATFRCMHCFTSTDSKRGLSNHVRFCDQNPDKEAIAKMRKLNNDKGAYCVKCDRHFGKKNTFDAHDCPGKDTVPGNDARGSEEEEK